MIFKFQYSNDSERNTVLNQNTDKYFIEEQNTTEGNFLIFSDIKTLEQVVFENSQRTNDLEMAIASIMGGV